MDMVFIHRHKVLVAYCASPLGKKSKVIQLSCQRNHESSLILASFQGSKSPHKTISLSKNQETIYLNHKNSAIRLLSNYKNGNFGLEISIPIKQKIHQLLPYRDNKVLILDKNSRISIMEIYPEESKSKFLLKNGVIHSKTEQRQKEVLDTIRFCPKEEYITVTSRKLSNGKNKFGFTKLFILRVKQKSSKGGIGLDKLYQLAFSYNFPKVADVFIPFYYKGLPVIAILEEKVGSRVYFYSFTGRECKKLGNTVVGTNIGCNQVASMPGSLNLFKILKDGFVYKVSFR